ncbi:MAG: hypothetical protein MUE58_12985 [Chitinophagaceae bacterium]|jgi:hypothetical protein|nr:hypothetical protein [Chitinophagaceae bacterium]
MEKGFKWFARIGGGIICAFYLSFFLGNGVPENGGGDGEGFVNLLPFSLVAVFGYFLGWLKPFAGGLILILAAFLFFIYFMYRGDAYTALVYGLPALFTGLSFVASVHKALV